MADTQFSLTVWKEKATSKLHTIQQWLGQRWQNEMPYVTYATVAGMTIWPIVEAGVQQGVTNIVPALYGVLGGLGSNLLANQIEKWKDGNQPPTEEEVMDWVIDVVPTHDGLRDDLDKILAELDAIRTAQSVLPPTLQTQFRQRLKTELEGLGNAAKFQAHLAGDGAIAQGDRAIAIGARGVYVGGSVGGSVITESINTGGGDFVGGSKTVHGSSSSRDLPIRPLDPTLTPLYNIIMKHFNLSEIQLELAFLMGIDLETITGSNKQEKVYALLQHCQRQGLVEKLITLCQEARPNADWGA